MIVPYQWRIQGGDPNLLFWPISPKTAVDIVVVHFRYTVVVHFR